MRTSALPPLQSTATPAHVWMHSALARSRHPVPFAGPRPAIPACRAHGAGYFARVQMALASAIPKRLMLLCRRLDRVECRHPLAVTWRNVKTPDSPVRSFLGRNDCVWQGAPGAVSGPHPSAAVSASPLSLSSAVSISAV